MAATAERGRRSGGTGERRGREIVVGRGRRDDRLGRDGLLREGLLWLVRLQGRLLVQRRVRGRLVALQGRLLVQR